MGERPEVYDARYLEGVRLFNAGDFWHAHEAWEGLWLDCAPADRRFYQGLIQAAASRYHASNGNSVGESRLQASALSKLADYPSRHRGLDLNAFRRVLETGGIPVIVLDPAPEVSE